MREFAIIAYGLATGLGFVWLLGFAVGYQDPFTPFILFSLMVGALRLGWKWGNS
jgi:hypothetical protein